MANLGNRHQVKGGWESATVDGRSRTLRRMSLKPATGRYGTERGYSKV